MTDRHEISARALRLVLACMGDDWDALDSTLAEIDERDVLPTMRLLAGLTAYVWTQCSSTALADITAQIAECLDTAEEHR